MAKTLKLSKNESDFQTAGETVESKALEAVRMGLSIETVRRALIETGAQVAKEAGLDPVHAALIIDGIRAKFDADVAKLPGARRQASA